MRGSGFRGREGTIRANMKWQLGLCCCWRVCWVLPVLPPPSRYFSGQSDITTVAEWRGGMLMFLFASP